MYVQAIVKFGVVASRTLEIRSDRTALAYPAAKAIWKCALVKEICAMVLSNSQPLHLSLLLLYCLLGDSDVDQCNSFKNTSSTFHKLRCVKNRGINLGLRSGLGGGEIEDMCVYKPKFKTTGLMNSWLVGGNQCNAVSKYFVPNDWTLFRL